MPNITLHVVPKDKQVDLKQAKGINLIVVNHEKFKLSLAVKDAFLVASNAILFGSASNAFHLEGTYVNCDSSKNYYPGFGHLGEHFAGAGSIHTKDTDFIQDTLVNTNVQVYMLFVLFVANVWFFRNPSRTEANAEVFDTMVTMFRHPLLSDLWQYNVNTYESTGEDSYRCKINNIEFSINFGSEVCILDILSDWVGIGDERINTVVYN